jgi:hypothetical protein
MASRGFNLFGILERRIYFGDAFDYTVTLASRRYPCALSASFAAIDKGERVLPAHPDQCVLRDD